MTTGRGTAVTALTMISCQADQYMVTPIKSCIDRESNIRSGLKSFVRDVRMRSLRKKKWCGSSASLRTETDHIKHFACSDLNSSPCSTGIDFFLIEQMSIE